VKRVIISAPFGEWFHYPNCTSIRGTYTWERRAGPIKRWWRVFKTVRYSRRSQSWINKLGLPNPGINSASAAPWDMISIHGFYASEWERLVLAAIERAPLAIELNVSCPNVSHRVDPIDVICAAKFANRFGMKVVVKLPPIKWMDWAIPLYESAGVRCFHACNTIPTPGGGLSGKVLKPYSLWATSELKDKWGKDVDVIGGGGITLLADVIDFLSAGADRISVASMLFNPFNWRKPEQFAEYLTNHFIGD
jgi:dihydroorotate dehydrogenase